MHEKNHYSPAYESVANSLISVNKYRTDFYEKTTKINEIPHCETGFNYWIHVKGLQNEVLIQDIGYQFGIHPLMIDDVLHTVQRPKIDEMDDSMFLVMKMFYRNHTIHGQQVSFFLKNNFVVSFEEHQTNMQNLVEKKLEENRAGIRSKGEDYLLFSLLDVVIDQYFDIEEFAYKEIEKIEKPLNANPEKQQLLHLIKWRKDLLEIKRTIAPLSDILHAITRSNYSFFQKENKLYFRDLHDHVMRVLDTLDMHRESASSLVETYHAQVNNKMNEVMKTLTIMSSIFIPLSFIAGVYGMNFDNMPELHTRWGYFFVLGGMFAIAIGMVIYFKKKKYF